MAVGWRETGRKDVEPRDIDNSPESWGMGGV